MHHKRKRLKNARSGCLMCKPQKINGAGGLRLRLGKTGFGKLRSETVARDALRSALKGPMAIESLAAP